MEPCSILSAMWSRRHPCKSRVRDPSGTPPCQPRQQPPIRHLVAKASEEES
jgi:hypothetical protein